MGETSREGGAFPSFDAFSEEARKTAHEIMGPHEAEVAFVVEGGVPEIDDGGEPLLGCYVPPREPTAPRPGPAEITVFYRTFQAIWEEDGPYDWQAELAETVEHELEHHEAHLRGHDPMHEEEQDEIDREARKVLGTTAIVKDNTRALGKDFLDFLRRTWLIWLILVIVTVLMTQQK
jgi:hypothetical protein